MPMLDYWQRTGISLAGRRQLCTEGATHTLEELTLTAPQSAQVHFLATIHDAVGRTAWAERVGRCQNNALLGLTVNDWFTVHHDTDPSGLLAGGALLLEVATPRIVVTWSNGGSDLFWTFLWSWTVIDGH